jgi:hypothetical protein
MIVWLNSFCKQDAKECLILISSHDLPFLNLSNTVCPYLRDAYRQKGLEMQDCKGKGPHGEGRRTRMKGGEARNLFSSLLFSAGCGFPPNDNPSCAESNVSYNCRHGI